MKNELSLNLRRVRTSLRTNVDTGSGPTKNAGSSSFKSADGMSVSGKSKEGAASGE